MRAGEWQPGQGFRAKPAGTACLWSVKPQSFVPHRKNVWNCAIRAHFECLEGNAVPCDGVPDRAERREFNRVFAQKAPCGPPRGYSCAIQFDIRELPEVRIHDA